MKIIGINGSPKREKSQTRRLVLGVLEGARQAGADVTFVDICGLDIKYLVLLAVLVMRRESASMTMISRHYWKKCWKQTVSSGVLPIILTRSLHS